MTLSYYKIGDYALCNQKQFSCKALVLETVNWEQREEKRIEGKVACLVD